MTATANAMPLLVKARTPRLAVDTAGLSSSHADADAGACRLAAAVARGDEAAFRELYERYQGRLLRLALVLARGDEALAQDAVQAAFIMAAKKLRRAEGD